MPIYEYRCSDCGHELEALQKITDAPLTECPACHTPSLRKKVSAAGFQLKGSGWYVTDFRNSGAKPAAKDDAKAGDKANGDAKTEAKAGEAKSTESTTTTTKASGGAAETKSTTTTSGDKAGS